ncbi:hypothetical protein HUK84_19685, partial [Nguyenibacter vanlangensis]|nr:hypothetical protein [Nguyenibacter vanlangensis]
VRLVPLPDGRAAVDIDKPADLAQAEAILSRAWTRTGAESCASPM